MILECRADSPLRSDAARTELVGCLGEYSAERNSSRPGFPEGGGRGFIR